MMHDGKHIDDMTLAELRKALREVKQELKELKNVCE